MPPYWSLGFHLCRYGYNSLENMQAAVDRTTQYGIPHDAQWGDIDIMDRELDFTVSPDRYSVKDIDWLPKERLTSCHLNH